MSTFLTLNKQTSIKEEMQKYASKVTREGKALTKQWVSPNRMFQAQQHVPSWYSMQRTKQASKGLCGWPPTHCLSPVIECTCQFCCCHCWKNNDHGPLTSAVLDLKPPFWVSVINLTSFSLTEIILILSSENRIMPL